MTMSRSALLVLALLILPLGTVRSSGAAARGFVLTSDYTTGTLSVVDLDTRGVTPDVAVTSPDAVARWYEGLLYVVNRFGYDNVQVIDPAQGYATVTQFSVGNGTNPQDIAFVSPEKAYVSRLGSPDLLVVNPATGATLDAISLAAWADGDGIPEASRMTLVGHLLLVALQRMMNFVPTDTSLVVAIDTRADTVFDADPFADGKQALRLVGTNPTTVFAALPWSGPEPEVRLLLGCTGHWGALDGGIEEIVVPTGGSPAAIRSLGFAITEESLGGDVLDVVAHEHDHSYALISDLAYNTSLVAWDPASGTSPTTVYAPGGYSLSDAGLNDRGELYVCNSSFTAPGLHVFRVGSDTLLAGPLATGLPPVQIVFDAHDTVSAPPARPVAPPVSLAPPSPNPAQVPVRFSVSLPGPGHTRIDIHDLAGRLVRTFEDQEFPAGTTVVRWDLLDVRGRRVPAGVYLVRLATAGASASRRVVVLN
jgi:hypothetical protein